MRIFTKLGLLTLLLCLSASIFAQETTGNESGKGKKKNKKTTTTENTAGENTGDGKTLTGATGSTGSTDGDKPAGSSGDGKIKDSQNQMQFMKPDVEASKYNFYRRKEISTPLMMSYDEDSMPFQRGKKRQKQQQAYLNNQYYFPARPKDQWELGINGGGAYILGDVSPHITGTGVLQNIGGGFTIRKSFGYVASLRFGYNFMMSTGRNWEPDANLQFNPALTGKYNPNVNYWNNPSLLAPNTSDSLNMNKMFFYNYRTYMHEAHFAVVANFGNVRFHRERNFLNFYVLGGVSAMMFTTYMDALDANDNVYDFSHVHSLYFYPNGGYPVDERVDKRKEALKRLKGILDGKYESHAENENNALGYKNWQLLPGATIGGGLQFHLSKWVTLGLEERVIFTGSDLLDGYRWSQDEHNGFTGNNDLVSYSSINILINLGKKKTEPLYWLNPMQHIYKKLGDTDPKKVADDILKDDDDDGVINALDKEPNTKKDCPVNTHGVALDSDKDGIIDCDDKEPFSAPGYPVDSFGVAIIPPNPCCDTTGYGSDGTDGNSTELGPDGKPINGGPGNGKGRKGSSGYDCSKIELPGMVFDDDKYYLDPQYYGNLHTIAERMQMCPDMKLVVTGFDESKNDQKYNEQLAWNRANAAVDYLVEKYGISRDRFIIKYQGGKKAATGTPFERKMKNKVEFRYANEGESGDSNPPAPHPGLKAGSNK